MCCLHNESPTKMVCYLHGQIHLPKSNTTYNPHQYPHYLRITGFHWFQTSQSNLSIIGECFSNQVQDTVTTPAAGAEVKQTFLMVKILFLSIILIER